MFFFQGTIAIDGFSMVLPALDLALATNKVICMAKVANKVT